MGNGCTGQCCVAFPLNAELADIPGDEGDLLRSMLVALSPGDAQERMDSFYPGSRVSTRDRDDREPWVYYRCVHWDEETRLCRIYEDRPQMCRDFPGYGDGAACEYGCDCQDRRTDA